MQQGFESRQQGLRDDAGALCGWMDAVGLNRAGDVDQVFVDHRHKSGVVFSGKCLIDLVKVTDVIGAVIGRQRDACEQDLNMRGLERGDNLIQIALRLFKR